MLCLLEPDLLPLDPDAIRQEFARQDTDHTCGAAAVRHALLLGGLNYAEAELWQLLKTSDGKHVKHELIPEFFLSHGFEVRELKKHKRESTREFFERMASTFDQGAIGVTCVGDGGTAHWICVASFKNDRVWVADSFASKRLGLPWWDFGFESFSPSEFDAEEWGGYMMLVTPGPLWEKRFRQAAPFRDQILNITRPSEHLGDTSALLRRSFLYLNSGQHTYTRLKFRLRGGVCLELVNKNPYNIAYVPVIDYESEVLRIDALENKDRWPEVAIRLNELVGWQLT